MAKEFSKILWDFLNDEGNKGWHESVVKKIGYEVLKEHFNYQPGELFLFPLAQEFLAGFYYAKIKLVLSLV